MFKERKELQVYLKMAVKIVCVITFSLYIINKIFNVNMISLVTASGHLSTGQHL